MNDKNTQLLLNAINDMKTSIDRRFDSIDTRLDSHDEKLDSINTRLDSHDEKFDSINARLDSHDENLKDIKQELTSLGNIVTRMEAEFGTKVQIGLEYASIAMEKFDNLQKSVNTINSKLDTHDLHIEVLEEKVL